jgi:hypothetical protein
MPASMICWWPINSLHETWAYVDNPAQLVQPTRAAWNSAKPDGKFSAA